MSSTRIKTALQLGKCLAVLSVAAFLLTGCKDLVEIQDRDFVLAIGISYQNQEYQVTYSLPDLGKLSDQGGAADQSSLLRTYKGQTLSEIEQSYNYNSENRLDYRHLQVILLETSICSNPQAMNLLLNEINENYDISHNVLVYYYDADVTELMGMEGINSSIGEHLKKLNHNNRIQSQDPAQIGSFIDCIANQRTLYIPTVEYRDNSVAIEGGILFQENQLVKKVSQADRDIYDIVLGKSNESLFRLSKEHLIEIKQVKTKSSYELTEQGPVIRLEISGTAKSLPEQTFIPPYPKDEMNAWIRGQIENQIERIMKTDGIDYLNLYEKSSYKNRQMWLRYQDRLDEFIADSVIDLTVDIHYEN